MLSKSRCPHTGVVNFYTRADPLLAVGSVAAAADPSNYVWRCYLGAEASGLAPNLTAAEACLRRAIAGELGPVRTPGHHEHGAAGSRRSEAARV